jgi:competence protein ComEA
MFNQLRNRVTGALAELEFSRDQRRALLAIFTLFLAVGGLLYFLAQGRASAASVDRISIPIALPTSPAVPSLIIVDVAGMVLRPGVYSLPKGSRAVDAIKAAGNTRAGVDTSDINLAHILFDGEQIIVGAPKYLPSVKSSKAKASKPVGPISINNGTQADLESLPGIGPVMASRIITYRKTHGVFQSIDDLRKVSGMGKATFAEISSLVRL